MFIKVGEGVSVGWKRKRLRSDREPMTLPISRCVSRFDGFVQRGNVVAEHLHYATEICRNPRGFRLYIEMPKLGFHLSSSALTLTVCCALARVSGAT